ncbi:MAG TPA: GNAT family N-acetyltransferase [Actinomycetota bacterium]|nr:GNAT family N-acetyltransferase [Actinomycetota bacterium]
MARLPDDLIRFWRALDDKLSTVAPTWWGAVVTDERFPVIWDTNYARIDRPVEGLRLHEVEQALVPALEHVGATTFHVVSFFPDETHTLLVELSSRGDTLSWDVVMRFEDAAATGSRGVHVEELPGGAELWNVVEASLSLFEITDPEAIRQLLRLEEDVLSGTVKRWFGVREDGRVVSLAALVELSGVAYLDNVATFPQSRGKGYASALTAHVVSAALAAGVEHVYLFADPQGPVAMYERLGFREVGRVGSTRGPLPTLAL